MSRFSVRLVRVETIFAIFQKLCIGMLELIVTFLWDH